MKKSTLSVLTFVLLTVLASGCAPASTTVPSTATPIPPTAIPIPSTSTPTPAIPIPSTSTPTSAVLDSGMGRIEGKVYQSNTNKPITNATVVLIDATEDPAPPFGLLFGPQIAETKVDAQGYFLFAVVKPSKYILALKGTSSSNQAFPFCDSGSTPNGWEALRLGSQTSPIAITATNMGVEQRFSVAAGKIVQNDIIVGCK
jgi:hypothetical protein